MRKMIFVVASVVFALVMIGCSMNKNANTNSGSTTTSEKPAATPAGNAASNPSDKIGVPECDDYIAKYESCVRSKVPEMMRGQLENALKTSRENWKRAAANEQTKGTLAAACKQASDAAAASMKAYGCTW